MTTLVARADAQRPAFAFAYTNLKTASVAEEQHLRHRELVGVRDGQQ